MHKFYAARVLGYTQAANSLEAGWAEESIFPDTRYAYWGYILNGNYTEGRFGYDLIERHFYVWRVRQDGNAGEYNVVAELYYNNTWNVLRRVFGIRCQNPSSNNCLMEFAGEAYANDQNFFEVIAPAPNVSERGVNFSDGRIRTAPNNWPLFSSGGFGGNSYGDAPYVYCPINNWYRFRGPYAHC